MTVADVERLGEFLFKAWAALLVGWAVSHLTAWLLPPLLDTPHTVADLAGWAYGLTLSWDLVVVRFRFGITA
jgi:hypothetical protein